MSSRECSRATCFWPETACNRGHIDHSICPDLTANSAMTRDDRSLPEAVAMPWSGGVLGLADLGFVAGRKKPTVLAIMGPQNAGKTTLLGAWYLLLARGSIPDDELRFSGSCSLTGWEVVASFLRWEPGSVAPSFPPHTSSRSTRVPGLLHLAFNRGVEHRRDYVMTDAPGEWFRKWAINHDAPDAEGARWAAEHADIFLLVADREALAGHQRSAARSAIQLLARRLAADLGERPVALVWTKADVQIPEDTERAVRRDVRRVVPRVKEFAVSIMSEPHGAGTGQGLVELLGWVLHVGRPPLRLPEPAGDNLDPLLIFGAR